MTGLDHPRSGMKEGNQKYRYTPEPLPFSRLIVDWSERMTFF
jgi:hypothetical protein